MYYVNFSLFNKAWSVDTLNYTVSRWAHCKQEWTISNR